MKKSVVISALVACVCACSAPRPENVIEWQTLGNEADSTGAYYVQRFTVVAGQPYERIGVCQFKRPVEPVDPQDTIIEILPGYFAIGSPRFAQAAPGDTVVVDIRTRGAMRNASYAPDGMHLVAGGNAVEAKNIIHPITEFPAQWRPAGEGARDGMIYGPEAFAINDSLRSAERPGAYASIPTPKSVQLSGKMVTAPKTYAIHSIEDARHDYYRAEVGEDSVVVYTNARRPQVVRAMLERRIAETADAEGRVPAGVIEDWADLPYRALMIDVARNFTGKEEIKKLIAQMSRYGLNVLHFHLGDDEGWRVELPALPELTAVGARRGYTTTDDVPFLKQIYSGNGNPDDTTTPANGFYTVDEFVDLLQYADALGVAVIPEFDSPGHSRAAIRAMEDRVRRTGDESLRLIEIGDTSTYTSAQAFHDNIMNPALEGPYKFWGIVFDGVKDLYAKAGVELPAVHIGGDEVPHGAWSGSAAAKQLMAEKGMTEEKELHAHFVERVADLAAARGIKIAGWQEVALGHPKAYNEKVAPQMVAVNCWTNAGDKGSRIASDGYPLILSNVDYLYFDQTPSTHPEEPGLTWGGIVDEFRPLHATVDRLCPGDEALQAKVAGISAHLFAETVRNDAMVERYIFPRLLGLAERAHSVRPTITDSAYFGAITAEMARWAAEGMNFNLRQPGIRVGADGKIEMNEAYGAGEIRYTLDGSDPTPESALYTGPVDAAGAREVRARLFYGPARSVVSILYL